MKVKFIYYIFTKFLKSTSLVIENKDKKIIGFLVGFIYPRIISGRIPTPIMYSVFEKKGLAQNLVEEFFNILRKMDVKRFIS